MVGKKISLKDLEKQNTKKKLSDFNEKIRKVNRQLTALNLELEDLIVMGIIPKYTGKKNKRRIMNFQKFLYNMYKQNVKRNHKIKLRKS